MSAQLKVFVKNINRYVPIHGGETLTDIYRSLEGEISFNPICARVNNKTEDMQFPVFAPKQVEFLPAENQAAYRVYIRSLCMMLYRAVTELYPQARLKICHSVSNGYYCRLHGVEVTPQVVDNLKDTMAKLVERDIPFERKERLTADVKEMFRRQGLDDKVRLLDTTHDLYTVVYRLDGIYDSYYGSLAPSTGFLRTFDLMPYHNGFLLLGIDKKNPAAVAVPIKQEKMFEAFKDYTMFNRIIGISNVGELNESTINKESKQLINVAEALHDKKISGIADEIAARFANGGARVVLIAGPSSSGKTTTTKRLATYLLTNLLKPRMISLDNYFVDRHNTPKDESGDYDYESLYALDLALFNDHLSRLLAGEEVALPTYNFELGTRQYKGDTLKLDSDTVLLIEGIHGLNPKLTGQIPESHIFRIYVSALTTLAIDDHNWVPTTDTRLLRRIIRDHQYRGTSPLETIRRWPSVRRGEERWIFPYQENADATFNSSLIFELGVVKDYAEDVLRDFPRDVPEYAEANRLMKFLSYFLSISEKAIPPTSLLREFLGGSSFHY